MSSILRNLNITERVPNFKLKPFKAYEEKLKQLWTDRKMYEVKFDLIGVTDKIANAIRRTVITELEVKALEFDLDTLDTNAAFLIGDELLDRIQMLPVNQDIDDNVELSLSVLNNTNELMVVYSSALNSKYIPGKFHLAELRPGERLRIPEIKVVRGRGYQHAKFCMSSNYTYRNLDYMDIYAINNKGNRIQKMVAVKDIASKLPKNTGDLSSKKIMVIPCKSYASLISKTEQHKIDMAKYDHIIINPEEADDDWIPEASSLLNSSTEFQLSFIISNKINPADLIPMVADNLIARLTTCLENIQNNVGIKTVPCRFTHEEEVVTREMWIMTMLNETYTLGYMYCKYLDMEDPDLPFVRHYMRHQQDSDSEIQIVHPNPKQLCVAVTKKLINIFKQIKSEAQAK